MRTIFLTVLFCVGVYMVGTTNAHAIRYAQCDPCGLCKDTTRSNAGTQTVYIQPARWGSCFRCLYPILNPTPPVPAPVPCEPDEEGKTLVFHDIDGSIVSDLQLFRCDTLLMGPLPSTTPGANAPTIVPQSGRMFSDVGCISVDTANHRFSDPNASVDVIQILLNIVINITGAVGVILVMASSARLILSKGDPEKIHQGKRALVNVIAGVLLTLFSLFIFRFLAAEVLRIPGFN